MFIPGKDGGECLSGITREYSIIDDQLWSTNKVLIDSVLKPSRCLTEATLHNDSRQGRITSLSSMRDANLSPPPGLDGPSSLTTDNDCSLLYCY